VSTFVNVFLFSEDNTIILVFSLKRI